LPDTPAGNDLHRLRDRGREPLPRRHQVLGDLERAESAHFLERTRDEFIDDIFRPGIQTIKSIDPTAKIVGPVLSNAVPPWYFRIDPFYNPAKDYPPDWTYWLDGILKSDTGPMIDVISHHAYENRAGDVISDMSLVHNRAASDGFASTPIWLTETAFASCNGSTQTQQWIEVINTITLGMKKYSSWWNGVFYFQISDDPSDETGAGQCKNLTGPRPGLAPHGLALASWRRPFTH
jgi:hypothetical protein